jgi:hypothetical protein
MISRMTPKMIRDSTSKTATTRLRSRSRRKETEAATRSAMIRMRRISFSTNGPASASGSRSSVMKATSPVSPPASSIWDWALSRPDSLASPSNPPPGLTRLPAMRPSARAITVMERK